MNKTPLNSIHHDLGAKMVDFGGWEMPVQYEGIIAEHNATRTTAGIFDICHMGEFIVKGEGSRDFLNSMVTAGLKSLAPGKCRYGLLLNEEGGIQDDLITYCLADEEFMLVVNAAPAASDLAWIEKYKPEGVTITDISNETAKLDVQGPTSRELVEKVFKISLKELGYFSWEGIAVEIDGKDVEVMVSRTGYTGELGFELYFNADAAVTLWSLFTEAGAVPVGLGARDTLRLEASLPLSGQDMGPDRTPAEGNFMKFIRKSTDFVGRAKITAEEDLKEILIGFKIEGRRAARHDMEIFKDGAKIGVVTSGSIAPSLDCTIGLGYVDPAFSAPGTTVQIGEGRKALEAVIAEQPFYSNVKG